jgi:hypothetical protein
MMGSCDWEIRIHNNNSEALIEAHLNTGLLFTDFLVPHVKTTGVCPPDQHAKPSPIITYLGITTPAPVRFGQFCVT